MSFSGIKLKLGACVDCHGKTFTLSELTGPWSATLNPYGWQANSVSPQTQVQLEDAESASLTVTSPDGNVYGPYDILAIFPNVDGTTIVIDPENIPLSIDGTSTLVEGQAMMDGVWQFDYVVKGEYNDGVNDIPFHYRCLRKVFVTCSVACCVDKLNAKMDPTCGCSGKGNKSASVANLTLLGVNAAFKCGNEERAKFLLEKLQGICNNNCKGC